jgi:hypothetical protein
MTIGLPFRIQDLSTSDWDQSVALSYHWLDGAGNVVVWDGARTPLSGMKAGEVREITASVTGPALAGSYVLRWDIVKEGVAWFSSQDVQMPQSATLVAVPAYGALYAPASATISGPPGATVALPLLITNTGSLAWDPARGFAFAYHVTDASGTVVWNGQRTGLAASLAPDRAAIVNAAIVLPATKGTYTVQLDLVQEGVTWFSGQGVPTAAVTLAVQ